MERLKFALSDNLPLWICTAVALLLLIGSFLVPPMGVIDGSILAGVAEVFAFAALWAFIIAFKYGKKATFRRNDVEISVDGEETK